MRVFSVVGARPQFIKAAPLSLTLRETFGHDEFLVHTGQHYDDAMSAVFFQQLGIPEPDVNLGVGSGTHAEQTAGMLPRLEQLMMGQAPDWVLVYGDTNSTLAAALAAAKLNLKVAHLEAGLRSFNRTMPEEINRVLTDHVSELLFCPTPVAVTNLEREGITNGVLLTGDIMTDAVLRYRDLARAQTDVHERLGIDRNVPYALVTIHRPANADSPDALGGIMSGLARLNMPAVFTVHPRTRKQLDTLGLSPADNVHLVAPLSYLDMQAMLGGAAVLITDSGGLQKEAYILEVPCVTVRTETEWVETVESGWNRLCAPDEIALLAAVEAALQPPPTQHPDFYGDGTAAQQMVTAMVAATT